MSKRIICSIMAMATVLVFLAGCGGTSAEKFGFSFLLETGQSEIVKGARIGISVVLTNDSDKKYTYTGAESDFRANVKLYCDNGGAEYEIAPEAIPSTDDVGKHTVGAHESRSFTFYFAIPGDAPSGDYNLKVSYGQSVETYSGIFTLSASLL
ncbi:MAG: hypothetical protein MR471_03015 [Clostridia bacterium]|nr:hypothetical protein [Clostridia bacterium]MDY3785306.1 hypothetical protein [Eubacteriales bacterium]